MMDETVQEPHWLPHTRIQHVFHTILSSKSTYLYRPGISFEIWAQRLPNSAWRATSKFSSSYDHFSLRIPPLRWLWYRSLHCLPLLPSNLKSWHILLETSLHLWIFSISYSLLKISSSWVGNWLLKVSMAFFQSLLSVCPINTWLIIIICPYQNILKAGVFHLPVTFMFTKNTRTFHSQTENRIRLYSTKLFETLFFSFFEMWFIYYKITSWLKIRGDSPPFFWKIEGGWVDLEVKGKKLSNFFLWLGSNKGKQRDTWLIDVIKQVNMFNSQWLVFFKVDWPFLTTW